MAHTPEKKKRGPVEIIEGKGVKVPVYYSPYRNTESYLLAYYTEGKRRRERAPSIEAARRRSKELVEELSTGTAHVASFTPKEAAAVNTAVDILFPYDIALTEAARQVAAAKEILGGLGSIEEAAKLLVAERQRQQIPMKKFGELVKEFLEEVKPPTRSYRYWQDCSSRLGLAAERFKNKSILEIGTLDLETHLNTLQRRVCTKEGVRIKAAQVRRPRVGTGTITEGLFALFFHMPSAWATCPGISRPRQNIWLRLLTGTAKLKSTLPRRCRLFWMGCRINGFHLL